MTLEELESFDELNTDLHDIDELDMGLEIISHHIRKSIQEFAEIIFKQEIELQAHKEKENKLRELARDMIMPDGDYGEVVDKGRKLLKILDGSDE